MTTSARRGWSRHALEIGLQALTWGFIMAVILASLSAPLDLFDESIPLVHGMLVQQGRTPSVDFASFYPPLGLYVNAAAFNLLGTTVLATRLVGATFFVVVIFLLYKFLRLRFPHATALIPAAVLLVAGSIGLTLNMAVWPGFSTALIALLTYLYYQNAGGNRRWLIGLTGFLTAVAILYRVNFGAYVAAVVFCDLLLQWWMRGGERWSAGRLKDTLSNLLAYSIPMAVFLIGFCFWVFGKNISTAVYEFTVNTQNFMALHRFIHLEPHADFTFAILLPLGWFSFRMVQGKDELNAKALIPIALAFLLLALTFAGRYTPTIAVITAALQIAGVVILHVKLYRLERSELCVLLFTCCLLHYYLSRGDWHHWRMLPIIYAILLIFLLFSRFGTDGADCGSFVSKGTSLALLIAAFCVFLHAKDSKVSISYLRNGVRLITKDAFPAFVSDSDRIFNSTAPGPGWDFVYEDADELSALRYVRSITGGADPIFSGVEDHSRIFYNNLRIYWLAGRPIGVKDFQLETRVATEENVQRNIIADFERNRVKCIIIDHKPTVGDKTFLKVNYVGSTLLDEFIASHFKEQARFGRFAVLTASTAAADK